MPEEAAGANDAEGSVPAQTTWHWTRSNLAFVAGVLPIAIAAVRLLAYSAGDGALLLALVQTLNVTALVFGSILPSLGVIVVYAAWALILSPASVPSVSPKARGPVINALAVATLVLLWSTTFMTIGVGAVMIGFALATRWLDRRLAKRRLKDWRGFGDPIALFSIMVLLLMSADPMWLPTESVEFRDGTKVTAVVLDASQDWATLVRVDDRQVLRLPARDLVARSVCNTTDYRSVGQVFLHFTPQPKCPKG
ncbi:hypothetical protein Q6346_04880 [Isoptericola sp. b490]|uniref:hypothetical protein n=1 Tax=Actinotalea lenta TaxID=3064654 RepID=UPI0027126158|nr:hypothetical protein [Isoptericola sp. b490]MDO8120647.1 hypothetical protein [Isoptericola sp. b490]